MGFLDDLFSKGKDDRDWEATHRGLLKEISYDDIAAILVPVLGKPAKAKNGGFQYWRGPLTALDEDYPADEFFQLSNKDYRGFGGRRGPPTLEGNTWFVYATSERAIRLLGNEVGALSSDVEKV